MDKEEIASERQLAKAWNPHLLTDGELTRIRESLKIPTLTPDIESKLRHATMTYTTHKDYLDSMRSSSELDADLKIFIESTKKCITSLCDDVANQMHTVSVLEPPNHSRRENFYDILECFLEDAKYLIAVAENALHDLPKTSRGPKKTHSLDLLIKALMDIYEEVSGKGATISKCDVYSGPFFDLVNVYFDIVYPNPPKPFASPEALGKRIERVRALRKTIK